MLVLTRKHDETIHIGDNIVITILKTKGKTVRIGIQAPHEVSVLRGELAEARQFEQSNSDATEPPAKSVAAGKQPEPHVAATRVSRRDRTRVLPSLLAGENPLRSYLNARSEVLS